MNGLNIPVNSYHSPTKFLGLRPANLTTYTIPSLFSPYTTFSSSLVTLARPFVSSSLQITNRSFTYASPHLGNQLPSSFRQPHSVHCPLVHLISCVYHLITVTTSLSSPITPSTFHFRLKNSSLSQILSSIVNSYSFRTDFTDLNLYSIKGALLCFSFWLRVLD